MSAAPNVFAQHIDVRDDPDRRHRCVLLDERHLRCLDCDRTLVLPSGVTSTSTSSRSIPNIDDPTACQQHPGHYAATCGPCRSERIAIPDGTTKTGRLAVGVDPTDVPEWTEARERLTQVTTPCQPCVDQAEAELMAAARAELAELRARQETATAAAVNDQNAVDPS